MSKVYEVELGGKTRRLTYDWASSRPFFKKHEKEHGKAWRCLMQACAGFTLDGKGNLTFEKDADGDTSAVISFDNVSDDVRLELLCVGLKADPADVSRWVNMLIHDGGTLADVVWPAVKAALYAGVTGKSVDLDELFSGKSKPEEPEGKAPETPEASTTD